MLLNERLFLSFQVLVLRHREPRERQTLTMLKRTLFAVLLLLVGMPGLLSAQATGDAERAQTGQQYLRPGDVVRLRIWREPEMSGEFQVDEAGVIVFPRLGERRVLGHTPESLQALLLDEYRIFLRNPSIDVIVLRRVRILGAVKNPGLYPVDPTVSVADALALAGGPTTQGDQNKIQILRDGVQLTSVVNESTVIGDSPIRSGDVLFVPERSWISRNGGVIGAVIGAVVSLTIALVVR